MTQQTRQGEAYLGQRTFLLNENAKLAQKVDAYFEGGPYSGERRLSGKIWYIEKTNGSVDYHDSSSPASNILK